MLLHCWSKIVPTVEAEFLKFYYPANNKLNCDIFKHYKYLIPKGHEEKYNIDIS